MMYRKRKYEKRYRRKEKFGKEQVQIMQERENPLTEAFFYILLALRTPNHGYGIVQEVKQLTGGRLVLGAGTLYGALQALQKKEWIEIYSVDQKSRKKKEYVVTEQGKEVFRTERKRLVELLKNARLMD